MEDTQYHGLYQSIINQGGGCVALGKGRRVMIGNKEVQKLLNAGDGFVDIQTATPKVIADVVNATSSWKPSNEK